MKRLTVLLMLSPLGCSKPETPKPEAPKEPHVIRKDGWIVIAPPPAVYTEKGGEIVIVEHGTVTTIRFGTGGEPYLPSVPPPARPRVPPPEGKPFPPSGPPEKIPPSGPPVPPIPDPLPLPSPGR